MTQQQAQQVNGGALAGRVAVVTGGAQGIGRAICETLARDGATVIVADLNLDGAAQTAKRIADAGGRGDAATLDVADETSVTEFYRQILATAGRLDILVNNAGICRMIPILDIGVAEWDRIMAVNLRGTFLMSREALRIMKEQKSGRIISLASASAKLGGVAAGAHYAASKAGVICFTKSLALQAAPYHVNANAVCPGPMATEMTVAWGDKTNEAFRNTIPWKEYGQPQDVANAVAFLASDRARYITGEIIDVNGGLVMD
ncbi:MAG: SDR family NAD(P)-dependent oxidoreductase [Lentisphaeria bacterium]